MTRELWFLKLVKKIAPLKARKTKMSQLISIEIAYLLIARGGRKVNTFSFRVVTPLSDLYFVFQM